MYTHIVHRFGREGDASQMQLLEDHFVLCERSCFIGQQVLDATELFRDCGAAHDRFWNILVALNKPGVHNLAHVEVDAQAEENSSNYAKLS